MKNQRMRHVVYNITYHFVWTPKYRRAVLDGAIADRCVSLLNELVPSLGGDIVELVVRPDHIHLFAHFPPTIAPYQIAHRLKGATSHALREEFPALKSRLPSLWTHSYMVMTVGEVSDTDIRKYVESQKGL